MVLTYIYRISLVEDDDYIVNLTDHILVRRSCRPRGAGQPSRAAVLFVSQTSTICTTTTGSDEMGEAALPEELIHDILEMRLFISPAQFFAFPSHEFARWGAPPRRDVDRPPASDLLLVSKRWLRIGSRLLYKCVRISMTHHTIAIAELLKKNPALGTAIRSLRLDGGMGKELYTIIDHAPNIESLYVSLHFRPSQGIAGLRQALPLLNPTKLYLHNIELTAASTPSGKQKLMEIAISDVWSSLVRRLRSFHYTRAHSACADVHPPLPVLPHERRLGGRLEGCPFAPTAVCEYHRLHRCLDRRWLYRCDR